MWYCCNKQSIHIQFIVRISNTCQKSPNRGSSYTFAETAMSKKYHLNRPLLPFTPPLQLLSWCTRGTNRWTEEPTGLFWGAIHFIFLTYGYGWKTTVGPVAMWPKIEARQNCRLVCASYSSGTVSHMLPSAFRQLKISLNCREIIVYSLRFLFSNSDTASLVNLSCV